MRFFNYFGLIFICFFTLNLIASPNTNPKEGVFKDVECAPDIVGKYFDQLRDKPSQELVYTLQLPMSILSHAINAELSKDIHQKSRQERFNLGHFKGGDGRIHCMFCEQINRKNPVKYFMAVHYMTHLADVKKTMPSCNCKVSYKKNNFKPLCCYVQLADKTDKALGDDSSSISSYDSNRLYCDDSDSDTAYSSDSDTTSISIDDLDSDPITDDECTKRKKYKYGFFPFIEEETNKIKVGCFSCDSLIALTYIEAREHVHAHEAYDSGQLGCKDCKLALRPNDQHGHNCQLAWEIYQKPLSCHLIQTVHH